MTLQIMKDVQQLNISDRHMTHWIHSGTENSCAVFSLTLQLYACCNSMSHPISFLFTFMSLCFMCFMKLLSLLTHHLALQKYVAFPSVRYKQEALSVCSTLVYIRGKDKTFHKTSQQRVLFPIILHFEYPLQVTWHGVGIGLKSQNDIYVPDSQIWITIGSLEYLTLVPYCSTLCPSLVDPCPSLFHTVPFTS